MAISIEILKKLPKAWQTAIKYAESRAITLPVEAEKAAYKNIAGQARSSASDAQAQAMAAAERAKISFPQYGVPSAKQQGLPQQASLRPGPTQAGMDYMSAIPKSPIDEAAMLAGMRPGIQETVGSVLGSQASQGSSQLAKILAWAKANPVQAGALGVGAGGLAASPFLMQGMGTQQQPPTDAMQIDVSKPESQLSPQVQQQPMQQGGQTQPNKFWEWFKQYGVPLGAAGIGMASDSALPAATGFSTGYVGQREKLREEGRADASGTKTKPVYIWDVEKGEVTDLKGTVIKAEDVQKNAEFLTRGRPQMGGYSGQQGADMILGGEAPKTAAKQAQDIFDNPRFKEIKAASPDATDEEIMEYLKGRGEI